MTQTVWYSIIQPNRELIGWHIQPIVSSACLSLIKKITIEYVKCKKDKVAIKVK